jgi:TonB family protein
MKSYLTLLILVICTSGFANPHNQLNNWLDSTYQANEISKNDAWAEFSAYSNDNYKKAATVSEFLYQFKPKKRTKGPEEFNLKNAFNYPSLNKMAAISQSSFPALEHELYRIIFANNLQEDQNAYTYLWVYINHLNNLPLNATRPNDMAHELFVLKGHMFIEAALFERVALMILARKIFLENNYTDSDALIKRTYPNIKVLYLEKEKSEEKESTDNEPADSLLTDSEIDPSFIGGMDNMTSFIQLNINYPQFAKEMGERGIVFVKFIVDQDGSVIDVGIRRGVTSNLDREAARVIQLMPKWIPGEQLNKPVRVAYTIPIQFRLG